MPGCLRGTLMLRLVLRARPCFREFRRDLPLMFVGGRISSALISASEKNLDTEHFGDGGRIALSFLRNTGMRAGA